MSLYVSVLKSAANLRLGRSAALGSVLANSPRILALTVQGLVF